MIFPYESLQMASPKKKSYNCKVSLVKTLQMPTDGKHIRQVEVLCQYRIVWAELSERLVIET